MTFIENAELVCLEVGVCALSSAVGQAIIPIPILGAVIGNTVGTIMYNAASSSLSARETALVNSYLDDQRVLDEKLAVEHDALIGKLEASMSGYVTALDRAFSPTSRLRYSARSSSHAKSACPPKTYWTPTKRCTNTFWTSDSRPMERSALTAEEVRRAAPGERQEVE